MKRPISIFSVLLIILTTASFYLGKHFSKNTEISKKDSGTLDGCGESPALEETLVGSCRVRILSPRECQLIEISNVKAFKFEWTTDGTVCKTPWVIEAIGTTWEKIYKAEFKENEKTITPQGGYIMVNSDNIESLGLISKNGLYQWVVKSAEGSHPASRTFRVKK